MSKNFCITHHFYYEGVECPLCQQERYSKMADKYAKKMVEENPKSKKETDREITESDLIKLMEKFNEHKR